MNEDLLFRKMKPVNPIPVAAPMRWWHPGPGILLQLLSLLSWEEGGHSLQTFLLLLYFGLVITKVVIIEVDDSPVGRLRSRSFPVPPRLTGTCRTGTVSWTGTRRHVRSSLVHWRV
jgi:hypothetical protein